MSRSRRPDDLDNEEVLLKRDSAAVDQDREDHRIEMKVTIEKNFTNEKNFTITIDND